MKKLSLLKALPLSLSASLVFADAQVHNFNITGHTVINDEQAIASVAPFSDPMLVEAAAQALQHKVRAAGAFAAKVYTSVQVDGTIEMRVIEGHLAKSGVVVKPTDLRLSDEKLSELLVSTLQPGTVLTSSKTERAILLANDSPAIESSYSSIIPSDKVGEAKFVMIPVPAPLMAGHAYTDNFGSTYTGRNRVGGAVEFNSPFHLGDQLSIGANISDEGTTFLNADISMPVWWPGMRGGVSVDVLEYETDNANDLFGESQEMSAYLHYAVIRSRTTNLYADLRFSRESMKDESSTTLISDRVTNVGSVGLIAEHHGGLGGGSSSMAELHLFVGDLDLSGYKPYEQADAETAKTAGRFSRVSWRLNRLQHVSGPWQTFIETSGQIASTRLDSSQGISFGGPMDFTGYHAGEVIGDEGIKLHTDLRYNLPIWGGLQQWSLFYDIGRVKTHAVAVEGGFVVPGIDDNYYTLQSLGVGFHQQWKTLQVQAALGTAIDNEIPDALLDSSNNDNVHGWLQLNYRF